MVAVATCTSGSDGDFIDVAARGRISPVVGMRTWGGVIGIDMLYTLVDGTWCQPRYASYFKGHA